MKPLQLLNNLDAIQNAKWAFSTRRVNRKDAVKLNRNVTAAQSGDLVLGRVQSIGSHKRIQLPHGRPSALYEGDLIVAACGARYASDQFEGVAEIQQESTDLLAGGGCLGRMRFRNNKVKRPTRIVPIGLLTDFNGGTLNLKRYSLPRAIPLHSLYTVALVGASMNSGKTDAVASLVHGFKGAGLKVAAIKLTGTGAFGDYNAYIDAGADYIADFIDAGMVSTYQQPLQQILAALDTLLSTSTHNGCNVAVVEIADGVLQQETAALLRSSHFRRVVNAFLYAIPDSLSAVGGCHKLAEIGITPLALTGLISSSPLNVQEAEEATGLTVLSRESLRDPAQASSLFNCTQNNELADIAI
ncbi:MAG: hypothetical protein QNJ17_09360 [Desulfocapsaceae bacterium]|nr:hypothetical protein [Desulfocapsaceae bacterium]